MVVNVGLDKFISHELVEKTIILLDIILYARNSLVHRGNLEFNRGFDLVL